MRAECSWDHAAWLDDRIDGLMDAAALVPEGSADGARTGAGPLALAAGLAFAAMTLGGCAGGGANGGGITANKPQDVNAGLNALASDNRPTPDELHKFIERAATDLEDLKAAQEERRRRLAQANLTPPGEAAPAANPTNTSNPTPDPAATTDPNAAPDSSLASLAGPTTTPAPAQPAAQPTAQDRVRALAAELRTALNQQVRDPESSVSSALALAMLEMLSAQESGGGGAPSMANLSERERQAVQSVRDLIDALAKDPAAASDPSRVSQMLARSMDALASARSVRVARAELCQRVEDFGRFKPFEVNAFVAGRPHRVIVYTEIENYAYRDMGEGAPGGNRWAVELGQELQLYTGDGSMLAWRKPEEATGEKSRNKRRDFYITQMVELPRTLTVGPYTLKVVLRDKVSGARSEAIIPIQIVADEALARGDAR